MKLKPDKGIFSLVIPNCIFSFIYKIFSEESQLSAEALIRTTLQKYK